MSGRPPATYEDLRAVPEPLVAEIIGGELITSPRPRARHAVTTSFVAARLDWVCEVLSPSTARTDRVRKMAVYAKVGVGHVWPEPFGVRFDLRRWWPDPGPDVVSEP